MALTKVIGAGAEGLTLSSTSLTVANGLTLTDGDVTLASGHGISFAATADSSGGTKSSELFADYEEGAWTPTYTGSGGNPTVTYDETFGFYTRIGRHVNVHGRMRTDAFSGGGGVLQVSGLPFTITSSLNANDYTSGGGIVSNDFGSNNPHSTMVIAGSTSFYCIYGNYNVNSIADCQNGTDKNQIQFSFFYIAA